MNKLREMFDENSEYNKRIKEKLEQIIEQSYVNKDCCTCQNYIPVPEDLPGFCTAYPECKMNIKPMETCLFYKSNRE